MVIVKDVYKNKIMLFQNIYIYTFPQFSGLEDIWNMWNLFATLFLAYSIMFNTFPDLEENITVDRSS